MQDKNINMKHILKYKKKKNDFESPDLNKMQAVFIDNRTTIYIELGANIEEAKERFLSRANRK